MGTARDRNPSAEEATLNFEEDLRIPSDERRGYVLNGEHINARPALNQDELDRFNVLKEELNRHGGVRTLLNDIDGSFIVSSVETRIVPDSDNVLEISIDLGGTEHAGNITLRVDYPLGLSELNQLERRLTALEETSKDKILETLADSLDIRRGWTDHISVSGLTISGKSSVTMFRSHWQDVEAKDLNAAGAIYKQSEFENFKASGTSNGYAADFSESIFREGCDLSGFRTLQNGSLNGAVISEDTSFANLDLRGTDLQNLKIILEDGSVATIEDFIENGGEEARKTLMHIFRGAVFDSTTQMDPKLKALFYDVSEVMEEPPKEGISSKEELFTALKENMIIGSRTIEAVDNDHVLGIELNGPDNILVVAVDENNRAKVRIEGEISSSLSGTALEHINDTNALTAGEAFKLVLAAVREANRQYSYDTSFISPAEDEPESPSSPTPPPGPVGAIEDADFEEIEDKDTGEPRRIRDTGEKEEEEGDTSDTSGGAAAEPARAPASGTEPGPNAAEEPTLPPEEPHVKSENPEDPVDTTSRSTDKTPSEKDKESEPPSESTPVKPETDEESAAADITDEPSSEETEAVEPSPAARKDATRREITPEELARLKENSDLLIIDTSREPEELSIADAETPLVGVKDSGAEKLKAGVKKLFGKGQELQPATVKKALKENISLPEDKDTPIVIYDPEDRGIALLTADTLKDAGYNNVSVLSGGLSAAKQQAIDQWNDSSISSVDDLTVRLKPTAGFFQEVPPEALLKASEDAIIIDTGPKEQFNSRQGHIPGAVNIAPEEIQKAEDLDSLRNLLKKYGIETGSTLLITGPERLTLSYKLFNQAYPGSIIPVEGSTEDFVNAGIEMDLNDGPAPISPERLIEVPLENIRSIQGITRAIKNPDGTTTNLAELKLIFSENGGEVEVTVQGTFGEALKDWQEKIYKGAAVKNFALASETPDYLTFRHRHLNLEELVSEDPYSIVLDWLKIHSGELRDLTVNTLEKSDENGGTLQIQYRNGLTLSWQGIDERPEVQKLLLKPEEPKAKDPQIQEPSPLEDLLKEPYLLFPEDLKPYLGNPDLFVIDTRAAAQFKEMHIAESLNLSPEDYLSAGELAARIAKNPDRKLYKELNLTERTGTSFKRFRRMPWRERFQLAYSALLEDFDPEEQRSAFEALGVLDPVTENERRAAVIKKQREEALRSFGSPVGRAYELIDSIKNGASFVKSGIPFRTQMTLPEWRKLTREEQYREALALIKDSDNQKLEEMGLVLERSPEDYVRERRQRESNRAVVLIGEANDPESQQRISAIQYDLEHRLHFGGKVFYVHGGIQGCVNSLMPIEGNNSVNSSEEAKKQAANLAELTKQKSWTAAELAQVIGHPGIQIVDTRPRLDYYRSHVQGAINLPLEELPTLPYSSADWKGEFQRHREQLKAYGLDPQKTLVIYGPADEGTLVDLELYFLAPERTAHSVSSAFPELSRAGVPIEVPSYRGDSGLESELLALTSADLGEGPSVSFNQLKPYLDAANRSLVVIDIRPEDEFKAGHLPNSVNIPFAKIMLPDYRRGEEYNREVRQRNAEILKEAGIPEDSTLVIAGERIRGVSGITPEVRVTSVLKLSWPDSGIYYLDESITSLDYPLDTVKIGSARRVNPDASR
ncbi:MAG: hypothetical protein D6719_02085 [Candidatus Dadabacteria bacterium]|nr:MAG: hypothetical protein D6719_02085 [Candidatus Dadabacteria bacterium]